MSELEAQIHSIVGDGGIVSDPAPYLQDWRKRLQGHARLVIAPRNAQEISGVMKLCHAAQVPVVTQGGNTGLAGASVPDADGRAVLLLLKRMNRILSIEPDNLCADMEAGCVLHNLREAAQHQGLMFPLTLGSAGQAQIGGLIASNAGGLMTLRFGNMREQVLGLEIVLADGRMLNLHNRLRKNNTGMDLKQVFAGSEGTLGVITRAQLRLIPAPQSEASALLAVTTPHEALALLRHVQRECGEMLSACELIAPQCVAAALAFDPGLRLPFSAEAGWLVLLRFEAAEPSDALHQRLRDTLGRLPLHDGVLAESAAQAAQFWRLREQLVLAEPTLGIHCKHDIALPLGAIPAFLEQAGAALQQAFPGIRVYPFGHLGDGNLHYNCGLADGRVPNDRERDAIAELVHQHTMQLGGSISAEHGIGRFKRDAWRQLQDPTARAIMIGFKKSLDPHNILNPGVYFTPDELR